MVEFKLDNRVIFVSLSFLIILLAGSLVYSQTNINSLGIYTPSLNNKVYITSGNPADLSTAHLKCTTTPCEIIITGDYYFLASHDSIPIQNNTIYNGYGSRIYRTTDRRIFTHNSGIANDVIIKGFEFYDNPNVVDTTNYIIHATHGSGNNWLFYENKFYGTFPNSTTRPVSFARSDTLANASRVTFEKNDCIEFKSCFGVNGDNVIFRNNYLTAGAVSWSGSESEGIEWNSGNKGHFEGNFIYNFTEDGIDVSGGSYSYATIIGNHIYLKTFGLTSRAISSQIQNALIQGNIIIIGDDSRHKGIWTGNPTLGDRKQIIIGNTIIGQGTGTGIDSRGNYDLISDNLLINLSTGILMTANYSQANNNQFSDVNLKLNNTGEFNSWIYYNGSCIESSNGGCV